MKSSEIIVVDEVTYTVQPYVATTGMILFTKILSLAGEPLLKAAISLMQGEGKDLSTLKKSLEQDIDKIIPAFTELCSKLQPHTLDHLFKEILVGTILVNQSVVTVYDTHFAGRYLHLFKVVAKTLGVQYGDFLGGFGGQGKILTANQQSKPQ